MFTRTLLVCVALFSLCFAACNPAAKPIYPERRGGRGEACLITNDCKEPLLCIAGRCLDEELSFKPTAKVCVSAECVDSTDCCPPLSAARQEQCAQEKQDCERNPNLCPFYESTCLCERKCENHSCSQDFQECKTSSDCATGHCRDNRCVECSNARDCGEGFLCEQYQCQAACQRDEACGALAVCNAGRCEKRGCESDRECALFLGLRDAVCKKGVCGEPCQDDAQCGRLATGELSTCSGGVCKFVGCETNAECAASQHFSSSDTPYQLCLTQAEANKVR